MMIGWIFYTLQSLHTIIRFIPQKDILYFFANIEYHPCWIMIEHPKILKNLVVEDRLRQLHLHTAQATHRKPAYRHRLDSSPGERKFRIGDHVWLL